MDKAKEETAVETSDKSKGSPKFAGSSDVAIREAPLTDHPVANEYYEVRQVAGKGYGCIATREIKRGTRILADDPLMVVPHGNYVPPDIQNAFDQLTDDQKALYLSLADGQPRAEKDKAGDGPSPLSIFRINCMEWNNGAAVFPNAARFNHSCIPNATFSWHSAIGKEVVHAIEDIAEGEEIMLTYCGMTSDRTVRKWLLEHYGFVCDCRACHDDKSADRRFRIDDLQRTVKPFRGANLGEGNSKTTTQMLQLLALYKEDGEYSLRVAQLQLELALICEKAGDWKHGLEFAAAAVKTKRDCQGADFVDYGKYTDVLKRIYKKSSAAEAAARGA